MTVHRSLVADRVTLGYGDRVIVDALDLEVPAGRITTIVGANACGKSTLLKSMARLLAPTSGSVLLDGKAIHRQPTRQVARVLGLLPQSPIAPDGIAVSDLVSRGRHPHQGALARWTQTDEDAIARALDATGTVHLADRPVDELSGGQRQRAWIAMALAQETDVLLLDEPTTFLDISHQIDVLDLLTDLNRERGTTIVMVLHDLNLAARYADHLVAMADGAIVASGTSSDVLTAATVREVFGLNSRIISDPLTGRPMVVPMGRHHTVVEPDDVAHQGA
ncbi:ABC transporter ATP-binding protein [Microbacterium sp. cx-59]|uniref:ABC transporter ATP-binding protein n=1 Tax=Microbacterium sp. cx-59 TaxID=2891207 RepID=UPI001E5B70EA|nr:ABC transporter ATP-binding protein [Microbacterium sp. cx-59]MCC4907468.1 ABC transporter ATP-binding protein [Microbacterium sp. cx-59]